METNKKEWIKTIKKNLEELNDIRLIWFIEELEITIKPTVNNNFIFSKKHLEELFEENEITTMSSIMNEIDYRDKPDMILINGDEI